MDAKNVIFVFGLTLFAGFSTGVGSTLALVIKRTNTKFLSFILRFSAGIMIYESMIEVLYKAKGSLTAVLGNKAGSWVTAAAFFGGIFRIAIIDKAIPSFENPHGIHKVEEASGYNGKQPDQKPLFFCGVERPGAGYSRSRCVSNTQHS